ncbi:methanogenesis marker 9 domain-containing protein [Methanobacterium ferruginis]|jgi:putative methanogenesis marker domain 9|uniref:methanogenesis marker 9 domain-containing protein n=1 Tax=Methanobacterium ferruginis TaxID=710191 RepID=UPI002573CE1B|nr:methanogenesis marker 9 domain-containing protein [Methanobacterium ferruginis]MCC7551191.1 methanogenesis marker 9 domain-containing protein [Methanobacterium sp.]BDZ67567.1 methanogenesis marker 9 domain-containing protein [Methanobacterium ferruginis]
MVWEDSPSHVCRGGDKRALTFCCPPVKPCPVVFALEEAELTPQEYIEIKERFGEKTRLGEGEGTCFGSLVWCCKPSKPCPLRDMVLRRIGMSTDEYMDLKHQLSQELVGHEPVDNEASIKALSETFDVSKEEASQVLSECGNDLKTAMKVLRMKKLEL